MALLNSNAPDTPNVREAELATPRLEDLTLRECATKAARRYLGDLRGQTHDLHALFVGEVERALFAEAMAHCHGNISRAAGTVGVSRHTLRKKLIEYGIPH